MRWMLVCDFDGTLTGSEEGVVAVAKLLEGRDFAFVVATGRRPADVVRRMAEIGVPRPDFVIGDVGVAMHEGGSEVPLADWNDTFREHRRDDIRRALVARFALQEPWDEAPHKLSYECTDPAVAEGVVQFLEEEGLPAQVVYSHERFLDVLPVRGTKGDAVRFLCARLGIDMKDCVAVGDSGNDRSMLEAAGQPVLVANHYAEVNDLAARPGVYVTRQPHGLGVVEGVLHYRVKTW